MHCYVKNPQRCTTTLVCGACARDPVATQGRHLDLKGNNVLFDLKTGKVRLIGLGLAQHIHRNRNPHFKVPSKRLQCWHGPEYRNAKQFTSFIDIYALGWLFLDVLVPPMKGFHKWPPSLGCYDRLHHEFGTPIANNLRACFSTTPTSRPSYADLLAEFDVRV